MNARSATSNELTLPSEKVAARPVSRGLADHSFVLQATLEMQASVGALKKGQEELERRMTKLEEGQEKMSETLSAQTAKLAKISGIAAALIVLAQIAIAVISTFGK